MKKFIGTWREVLNRTILIMAIAGVITIGTVALVDNGAESSTAEDYTVSATISEEADETFRNSEGEPEFSGTVGLIAPIMKVVMLMGIPGLITYTLLSWRRRRRKRHRQNGRHQAAQA